MKKTFLVLLLALSLTLCSCTRGAREPERQADEPDSILVGLSMDSFVIERWQRDRDVLVSRSRELGMEVLVQDAGGVVEEQREQIRYFIRKGVKAIIVVPVDCNGLSDVLSEAKAAGVRIVCYDRLIQNAPVDLYLSFDNEKVGRLMAENLVANVPEGGKIVCINGSDTDHNVEDVRRGFLSVIEKSSLEIVYTAFCHNWEAQLAYDYVQQLLQSGQEFDGVMCGNDDLASMVYKALSERALMDSVVMVGQDADLAACQRVVAGWQSMTVHKQVENLARKAAESLRAMLDGEEIVPDCMMDNGFGQTPSILMDPVAVTRENVDQVIVEGGFHTREDVYANIRVD